MTLPRAAKAAVTAVSIALSALSAQEPPRHGVAGRLRTLEIDTQDVFTAEAAAANLFYGFANLLHSTTRDPVIEREVWFRRGDTMTWEQIEELERNLRALGLFGAATVETRDVGDGDVDLLVRTRDRFSLNAGVGVGQVGGVTKINFRLAEGNLFGTGKEVVAVVDREGTARTNYMRYTDRQLFGSWHYFNIKAGSTEEGPFADVQLVRPFKHLEDPLSYGAAYSGAHEDVDYYRFGESAAEIPQRRHGLRLFAALGEGPRELRSAWGLDLRLHDADYAPAFGPDAALYRVPGNSEQVELGPYYSLDYRPRFVEVTGLDALDYAEDLGIGASGRVRFAVRHRDETGAGTDVQPVLDVGTQAAFEPVADTYVTVAADGNARVGSGSLQGWRGALALHAFQLSLPAQTLASSLTFDGGEERQDLVTQLTLGEDNGLRGYPAREFAGSRFVRLNLEDRIDTGIELWSMRLGIVPFFDAGWVHGPLQGLSMGQAIKSVGCGLRFGSSHLLGKRMLRIDVAWPLDRVAGQDYGMSVSFAVGQVFTFFGNASELQTEF